MRAPALVLLLLAFPREAWAKEVKNGPIGIGSNIELSLSNGGLSTEVLGDQAGNGAYELSGGATFLRVRGGGYEGPTHYGHPFGIEGGMTIGWIKRRAIEPEDGTMLSGPTPAWGRLHLDFDATLLVDVFRMPPNRWLPPARIAFLGGFGLSTDFAYFFLGFRLAGALGPVHGEISFQRRFGESHSDPNLREQRVHVMAYWRSFGLGIQSWKGYSEDSSGLAATDRVFKGGYDITMFTLAWVPR